MIENDGWLLEGQVWHGRHGDAVLKGGRRDFRYRAPYLALDIDRIDDGTAPVALDRRALWSLSRHDYGPRDGSALRPWAEDLLGLHGPRLTLVTMPRSLFKSFNPVSFWLAHDGESLRAVIAEVSSTFGEHHCYRIQNTDGAALTPSDRITGEKLFHVSPFLPREGRYSFRFDVTPERFGAFVDWSNGTTTLGTSLTGHLTPLTRARLRAASLRHPFPPETALLKIHWQAARIFGRGLAFHSKPAQLAPRTSPAETPVPKGQPHA